MVETGLENVVERATIKFPREVSIDEVENLLARIADKDADSVNYSLERIYEIRGYGRRRTLEDVKITGCITIKESMRFRRVSFERVSTRIGFYFTTLKLSHFPSSTLDEQKLDVEVWDDIRSSVSKYFDKRQ